MDDLKKLQGLIDRNWLKRLADPMAEIRQQIQAAYVDPFREVRDRMLDSFGMQKVAETIMAANSVPSAVRDFLDQQHRQQEDYARLFEMRPEWERIVRDITDPIRALGIDATTCLDAIGLGPGSDLTQVLERFRERFEELPDEIRAQVAVLIQRGWCLDPDMTHVGLQDMVFAIDDGEEDEVQEALIEYFRLRLDDIETTLKERHPLRSPILQDAFKAHREGRYALSVPVFLAQADGITFDRVERQLYSRKHSKGVTGFVGTLPEDDMLTVYWSAFTNEADAPLTRDTQKLPDGFDGLNRHAVFHGTDPNYGTEVNSLRAVSVLNLASYLLTVSVQD